MATHDYTVRLDPSASAALEAEAKRRHVAPDTLAAELVRDRLPGADSRELHEALAALEVASSRMPEVDAVQLVREGREDLDRRSVQWLSS